MPRMQRQGTSNGAHHHQITVFPCGGRLFPHLPRTGDAESARKDAGAGWTFLLMANKVDGDVAAKKKRREGAARHYRSVTQCPGRGSNLPAGWRADGWVGAIAQLPAAVPSDGGSGPRSTGDRPKERFSVCCSR